MSLLEIPRGLLVGVGFGVVGISVWIVGILAFNWLMDRFGPEGVTHEDRP